MGHPVYYIISYILSSAYLGILNMVLYIKALNIIVKFHEAPHIAAQLPQIFHQHLRVSPERSTLAPPSIH
jgi:hypothetical protein